MTTVVRSGRHLLLVTVERSEEQMNRKPCPPAEVLIEAERFCKHQGKSFSDDAEVLDALGLLVRLRTYAASPTSAGCERVACPV
jgi:hypothetical protein